MFYPGALYREADAAARDRLLAQIPAAADKGAVVLDHLLVALAWIGDGVVQRTFDGWRRSPPPWRMRLHVPPEEYALTAGWQLTADGRHRALYYEPCYPLVPSLRAVHDVRGAVGASGYLPI